MSPPGRPRKRENSDLAPGLIRRRNADGSERYYYQHPDGRQEPVGKTLADAERTRGEILARLQVPEHSFAGVAARFRAAYLPRLARKTQHEYTLGLARLERVFGAHPIEAIKPGDVGALKRALADTPAQANRLKALLSRLWNFAREEGLTEAQNPCVGVRGYEERARDELVTPARYYAVWDAAPQPLRDWMDLSIITGARVSDVLALRREHLVDGALVIWHSKRRKRVRMPVEGDLAAVIERCLAGTVGNVALVRDGGQPVPYWTLERMFAAARTAAGETWQMRDLRAASATQAETLEEAADRLAHEAPSTTRRVYRRAIRARAGRLPRR